MPGSHPRPRPRALRPPVGQQLPGEETELVDVGRGGHRSARELLGAGVLGREPGSAVVQRRRRPALAAPADAAASIRRLHHGRRWRALRLEDPRDAEVEQLDRALAVTRMFEGLRSRCTIRRWCAVATAAQTSTRRRRRSRASRRAAPAVVVDRLARDVLHHDVGQTAGGEAGVVELGDVRMDELGEDPLLPQQSVGVGDGVVEMDDLDRHPALEEPVGALAEVDPAHAPSPISATMR